MITSHTFVVKHFYFFKNQNTDTSPRSEVSNLYYDYIYLKKKVVSYNEGKTALKNLN